MPLDFGNTCPDINTAIEHLEAEVHDCGDNIIAAIDSELNYLRTVNENMRTAADIQLEELQDRINELEEENNKLQADIITLKDDIVELGEMIDELSTD